MFGGGRGGGFDPAQLQQMMEQFGIDMTELDATSVRIETADGEVLVFDDPEVTRMDAQGQQTYQIIGEPRSTEATDEGTGTETQPEAVDDQASDEPAIPEDDIELVVTRTGAAPDEAREALEATDGDLAAAIDRLS